MAVNARRRPLGPLSRFGGIDFATQQLPNLQLTVSLGIGYFQI